MFTYITTQIIVLLDGAQRIDQLVNTIDDLNMDAVALTEHGNMFSVLPYYKQAKKSGIKPIIGCEIYVAVGSRFEKKARSDGGWGNNHLILLAQNFTGYRNLNEASNCWLFRGVLL